MKKRAAQVIRLVRKARNLTQVQLSALSNINYRHLQDIESGKTDLKFSTVKKIASTIRIPGCAFFKEPDSHPEFRGILEFGCIGDIMDQLAIGINLILPDGTLVYLNDHYAKNFSAHGKKELIIGKKIWEIFLHPQDREAIKKYFKGLVIDQPAPTRFVGMIEGPLKKPMTVVADWNYRFDATHKLVGFIVVIQEDMGIPLQNFNLAPSVAGTSV